MNLLVIYDIIADKRRRKMADLLEKVGIRINKSAFLCLNTPLTPDEMYAKLKPICTPKDSVYIFTLCAMCTDKALYLQQKSKSKRQRKTIFA